MSRVTVVDCPEYIFALERSSVNGDKLFIHITVHNWSHEVYKELLSVWSETEEQLKLRGEKEVWGALPEKTEGFAEMFGFDFIAREQGFSVFKKEIS